MNTPFRGNLFLLLILLNQLAISFLLPYIEFLTGTNLFSSTLSIVPLHFLLFIVPFIVYLLLTSQKLTDVLPLRKINFTNIGLIILMCITIQPLMMVLSGISSLFSPNNVSNVMSELYSMPLLIILFVTSLTPAITEEITLRGVLLTNYKDAPIRKAAFINGLLFGIIHLDLQQFMYACLLGFLFAYFVYYTKSIFASMVAHFTVNAIQTLLAYLSFSVLEKTGITADTAEQAANSGIMAVIVSFAVIALIFTPVCIVLFRAFAYYNKQRIVVEALQSDNNDRKAQNPDANLPETVKLENDSANALTESNSPVLQPSKKNKIINWPLAAVFIIFICIILINL